MRKWYEFSFKSLRSLVAYYQEKRREKEEHMLFIMQWNPFGEALSEIDKMFRKNKELKLHRYKAFRAWYKYNIDFMLTKPDIYNLSFKGSHSPYCKEDDPMYDPNAPDWEIYDREHDSSDDDFQDDDNLGERSKGLSEGDAFALGLGIGIGQGLFDGDSGDVI